MTSIKKEYSNRIEYINGQGKRHKEDGPAVEWKSGYFIGEKWWYINGNRHREDGPAVEYTNGNKEWYLYGNFYSEQDWQQEVTKIKLKRILEL
jgi:hypothetical protein